MQRCTRRSRKDFLRVFVAQRKTLQSTYSSTSQRKVHMLPQNPLVFQIIPTTKQTSKKIYLILSPRKSWISRLTPFSRSEFLLSPTESIVLTSGWRKVNDVCECKSASRATEVKTHWISLMRMTKTEHQRPDFFCHGPLCRLLNHWRQTNFKFKKTKKTFHQNQITEHACWAMELHGGQNNAQNQTRICLSKGPTLSVGALSHLSVTTGGRGGRRNGPFRGQRVVKWSPHVPD